MAAADGWTLLGVGLSLASIWLSYFAIKSDILKKISTLSENIDHVLKENGWSILDKDQATDLVNFYLYAVQNELRCQITSFIKDKCESKTETEARNFVFEVADQKINDFRNKLSRFRLKNGTTIDSFIATYSPTDSGNIYDAKEKVFNVLKQAISARRCTHQTYQEIVHVMSKSQEEAKRALVAQINTIYS